MGSCVACICHVSLVSFCPEQFLSLSSSVTTRTVFKSTGQLLRRLLLSLDSSRVSWRLDLGQAFSEGYHRNEWCSHREACHVDSSPHWLSLTLITWSKVVPGSLLHYEISISLAATLNPNKYLSSTKFRHYF